MDENYIFDLPSKVIDFTKDIECQLPSDDWFSQAQDQDQDQEDSESEEHNGGRVEQAPRTSCPSPKKKQRIDQDDDLSDMPRRSPRLMSSSLSKKHHVISTGTLPNKYKSSEELELEKIAKRREELAKSRKMHEVTYKKCIAKGKPAALRSAQPPTLPQEFHFHSDQRIKGVADNVEDTKVKDFAQTLRTALPTVGESKGGNKCRSTTKPKPFNFSSSKKYSSSVTNLDTYKSTAEQVEKYKDRFRSSSREKGVSSSKRPQSPSLTVAKTPTLNTRGRSRPVKALTREEEEQIEYEEHIKQQFKAHSVNHKILKEPLGVIKVPAKPPTTVKEFKLHSSNSVPKLTTNSCDNETTEFHAHPVNRKILEGQVGVKPAEKKCLTIPESPAFALRGRLRSREKIKPQEEVAPPAPKVVSKPSLHAGVPFRPQFDHKFTVPKPFAVEDHSKEMLKKKEEKIKQVLEAERKAREFHATLLPSDSPDQLPPKKTKPVTSVEPFNFAVDERGNKYKEEWKAKQIEEEEEHVKIKTQFHASSNKVVFKAPFVPEKSTRPLTEMSSFTLNTDQRAVKREQYNQQLKAHEAEIEAFKRQREERKDKEETEAVAQLRQEMVHKAKGVKKYKQVTVQPSDKPLTEAQSPFLRTQRTRSSLMSD